MFKWLFKKKGCAKHMNNKLEVIGIDHGWSMMKTISQVFVTGVKEITTTPALFGDVLEYEGKFYKVGTVRQEVKDTKVEDDSFYLLTLAAVAKELKRRGLAEAKVWIWAGFTIAAIIWTFVSNIKNPYLNLATLLIVLILLSFYYESGMWTRIINIVTFMGIGMLFEPVALLLLHAMNFHMGESYKYYFVMVICSFVRGNVMYILSKLISKKGMQIAAFPKEILGVLVMVFTFTVLNCCFVILLSLEAGSEKSLLMCASIVFSIVLTDYFMLHMMERFNYLVQKQYEDAMYREEMHYKDIYYEEAEKQNKEVQKLKHDMKHKLHELYHLVENSDGHELSEKSLDNLFATKYVEIIE
jgi:hypothetical protein